VHVPTPELRNVKKDVTNTDITTLHSIILNSVRQHNQFITQGNYKATCFDYRLVILRPILSIVSHKMLCTLWDPIVFTSMEYIKLNRLSVNTMGSQSVHSIL